MDTSIAPDVALLAGMGPETHLDTGWDSLLLRSSYTLTSALGGLTLQHWLVENADFASTKHHLYAVCQIHQLFGKFTHIVSLCNSYHGTENQHCTAARRLGDETAATHFIQMI